MSQPDEGPPSPPEPQSPVAIQRSMHAADRPPGNGVGVVAFISGLLGLVLIWTVLVTMVLSPLAAVLGAAGMSKGASVRRKHRAARRGADARPPLRRPARSSVVGVGARDRRLTAEGTSGILLASVAAELV